MPRPDRAAADHPVAHGAPLQGVVETFDDDVGLGTVVGDDGSSYRFHCTEITDGSRTIDVGASVSFVVGPAGPGVWEAKALRPLVA